VEEHMAILKMYDERIKEQAVLLEKALSLRGAVAEECPKEEESVIDSGGEIRLPRRKPRVVSDIQIVPPRKQQSDSASERTPSALTLVVAQFEERWKEVRTRKQRRNVRDNGQGTPTLMNGTELNHRPNDAIVDLPRRKATRVRGLPKNAVVAIKSKEESTSYADILKKARERINFRGNSESKTRK